MKRPLHVRRLPSVGGLTAVVDHDVVAMTTHMTHPPGSLQERAAAEAELLDLVRRICVSECSKAGARIGSGRSPSEIRAVVAQFTRQRAQVEFTIMRDGLVNFSYSPIRVPSDNESATGEGHPMPRAFALIAAHI